MMLLPPPLLPPPQPPLDDYSRCLSLPVKQLCTVTVTLLFHTQTASVRTQTQPLRYFFSLFCGKKVLKNDGKNVSNFEVDGGPDGLVVGVPRCCISVQIFVRMPLTRPNDTR